MSKPLVFAILLALLVGLIAATGCTPFSKSCTTVWELMK